LEANKNRLLIGGGVIVLIGLVYSFVSWHHEQSEISAGEALTQLVFTPAPGLNPSQRADQLVQLSANYAGTEAAKRAQLQAAAILFDGGNYPDAQVRFQKFLDAYSGPLAASAALGVAASLEAQGKLDQAETAYERVTTTYAASPANLQAQYSLGRLNEQQGKLAQAESYYQLKMKLAAAAATQKTTTAPTTIPLKSTTAPLLK
jgi:tetratricopeptide (TPR) repeat protein